MARPAQTPRSLSRLQPQLQSAAAAAVSGTVVAADKTAILAVLAVVAVASMARVLTASVVLALPVRAMLAAIPAILFRHLAAVGVVALALSAQRLLRQAPPSTAAMAATASLGMVRLMQGEAVVA